MRNRGRLTGTAALAAAIALLAGCGRSEPASTASASTASASTGSAGTGSAASRPASAAATSSATVTPVAAASPTPWPPVLPVPAARAGQHQTRARPPAASQVLRAEMTDLWAAIASGRPSLALPAFFPLVAYEQVKAIADPAADWHNRLVAEFRQDVLAAHSVLGHAARPSALIRVVIPEAEADWIDPGVCDNGVGYWHVANSRLVYRAAGQVRSVGISTLISWRGRWYVVHLGGEVRTSGGGKVDSPMAGPGTPGPPGGC
jgi:hypothetical protein